MENGKLKVEGSGTNSLCEFAPDAAYGRNLIAFVWQKRSFDGVIGNESIVECDETGKEVGTGQQIGKGCITICLWRGQALGIRRGRVCVERLKTVVI